MAKDVVSYKKYYFMFKPLIAFLEKRYNYAQNNVMFETVCAESSDGKYFIFFVTTLEWDKKTPEWRNAFHILKSELPLLTKKLKLKDLEIKEVNYYYQQTNFLLTLKSLGQKFLEEL